MSGSRAAGEETATMGGKGDKDGPQGVRTQGGEWAKLGLLTWPKTTSHCILVVGRVKGFSAPLYAESPPRVGARQPRTMGRQRCARSDVNGASWTVGAWRRPKISEQTLFGFPADWLPRPSGGKPLCERGAGTV